MTLTGTRVKDARQILMDREGVNIKSVKPMDNAKVELEIEVPADTHPGLYPMRLVTEIGNQQHDHVQRWRTAEC